MSRLPGRNVAMHVNSSAAEAFPGLMMGYEQAAGSNSVVSSSIGATGFCI